MLGIKICTAGFLETQSRSHARPTPHHTLQIWQIAGDFVLGKIGCNLRFKVDPAQSPCD